MKYAANGDDILGLSGRELFDPAVDQGERHTRFPRRSLRRRDHCSFGIEPRTASDKRGEANGQQAGPAADIEQGFVAAQGDLLRNFLEEVWRIRLAVASIEFNR